MHGGMLAAIMTDHLDELLYTNTAVRAMDTHAIQVLGIPGGTLMQRAAGAAYSVLRDRWPTARTVAVVCGPGNNGGDGFLVAKRALEAGLAVRTFALTPGSQGDAGRARQAYIDRGGVVAQAMAPDHLDMADVVVDALFGSGLSRPLHGSAGAWVDAINASGKPVLALDVPSGLDADTGTATGPVVRARATACFVAWKRGLFTGQAAGCCGALSLHPLHLPGEAWRGQTPDARLLATACLPPRDRNSHKGRFGHVLVVGGEHGMGGAVRLAGEAALRVGAGLVSVATRGRHVLPILAARPELMVHATDTAADLASALAKASVVALGPGLGQQSWGRDLWHAIVPRNALPLVLDADGLNLLAASPCDFTGRAVVLTPHPGEAARLLGVDTVKIQADRFAAARELARRYRAVVVLKGAGSLIVAPDGRVGVCRQGNPGMASGGMGDVLAGVIAALLAQGLPPWEAACMGTTLHARAGDMAARAGERGLVASDLFDPLHHLANGLED